MSSAKANFCRRHPEPLTDKSLRANQLQGWPKPKRSMASVASEALHPLQELRNRQVDDWIQEMDDLALDFVKLPLVQLGIQAKLSNDAFDSWFLNPSLAKPQPTSLPPLFRCLALCKLRAPEEAVKFRSEGLRSGPSGIQVEASQSLDHASDRCKDNALLTYVGDDGRPCFLLQLAKCLLNAETGKLSWILGSSIDLTAVVREYAIEYAVTGEAREDYDSPMRGRRNALTEAQISAVITDWMKSISNEGLERKEEQILSRPPTSYSSSLSESSSSSVSGSATFSPATTFHTPDSSVPSTVAETHPDTQFSTLSTKVIGTAPAVASFVDLVQTIDNYHQTYVLLAPPTLPLRSRPSPKYTFTEYKITHISPSLQSDDDFRLSPISPALSSRGRPLVHEVKSLSGTTRSSRQASTSSSRRSYSSSSSLPRHAYDPKTYQPTSPTRPPHLTVAAMFRNTAASTLMAISESMAAGKPFREYIIFSQPQYHPPTSHAGSSSQMNNPPGNISSLHTPTLQTDSSCNIRCGDQESSRGKWLYGVPMGDGRENFVGCWVCWVLDSEVEADVMGIDRKEHA